MMRCAILPAALLLLSLPAIAGQSGGTIPCSGSFRVDTLNAALASLDDNLCATLSSPDSCPEGHECAEAVETLAAYYSNCNIAHDDEDDAFQALEEANGPCMAHAEHAAHDNPEVAVVAAASKSKPWGEAMGAAALVNIVTLAGVALCVPVVAKSIEAFPKYYEVVGTSFAGGALLSTAVFLLLYESNHLIPITEKQTEGMAAAIWGSMVLLGFLVSSFVDLGAHGVRILRKTQREDCPVCEDDPEGAPNKGDAKTQALEKEAAEEQEEETARRHSILASVLVGDWLHNFCDGVFIATAFATCGSGMGWSVTAATVFHELAQEISDYMVLTQPHQANLRPLHALLLNFLSGTSVLIGALLVLSVNELEGQVTGMILAFGGGVYLQIGGVECMAKISVSCSKCDLTFRLMSLASFAVGAVAIGLVLLDHEHCVAGGGDGADPHAGHGHKMF